MRHTHRILAGLAAVSVAGCATITSGTTQSISVSSNVEGAEIFLDGVVIGTTPFTGPVDKNKEQFRIEAEGYQTETVSLSKSLEPIFWGNIIIGGTLGSITDFASGAAYQYAPASYQVDLQRAGQTTAEFQHEVAVRKFSMIYIDEIALDLANGGGDYLSALLEIMNGEQGAAVAGADVERAMEASGGYPVQFGDQVVELR